MVIMTLPPLCTIDLPKRWVSRRPQLCLENLTLLWREDEGSGSAQEGGFADSGFYWRLRQKSARDWEMRASVRLPAAYFFTDSSLIVCEVWRVRRFTYCTVIFCQSWWWTEPNQALSVMVLTTFHFSFLTETWIMHHCPTIQFIVMEGTEPGSEPGSVWTLETFSSWADDARKRKKINWVSKFQMSTFIVYTYTLWCEEIQTIFYSCENKWSTYSMHHLQ